MPCTLYIDGVPYSLSDSAVGIWIYTNISKRRHLIGVIRKRLLCSCGCRGWCTYWPILDFMRWSFEQSAKGEFASCRHTGEAFGPSDQRRAIMAGTKMRFKCIINRITGDWSEFCSVLGFPTWQSATRPCFVCSCFGDGLYDPEGLTLHSMDNAALNTNDSYERACQRCEVNVVFTSVDAIREVGLALDYDKSSGGSKGRSLKADFEGYGLRRGDRLEPNKKLRDVGKFEDLRPCPSKLVSVFCWRKVALTLCAKRCPLFDTPVSQIGLTPEGCIALDMLHTWYLGPCWVWARVALLRFFGVWYMGGGRDDRGGKNLTGIDGFAQRFV